MYFTVTESQVKSTCTCSCKGS